jgi:hypothetical protein
MNAAVDKIFQPAPVDPDAVHRDRRGKVRKPSRKVRDAIKAMQDGSAKTVTAAAEKVGLSRPHLSEMLRQPHIQAFIHAQVQGSLTVALLRSGDRARDLVDATSEHVSMDAVRHVQGLAGLRATDPRGPSLNISLGDSSPGYIISLRHLDEAPAPAMVDVTPPSLSVEKTREDYIREGRLIVSPERSIEADRANWESERREMAPRNDIKPI